MAASSPRPPRVWLFVSLLSVLVVGLLILWIGVSFTGAPDQATGPVVKKDVENLGATEAGLLRDETNAIFEKWVEQLEDPLSAEELSLLAARKKQFDQADALLKKGKYPEASVALQLLKEEIARSAVDEEQVERYQTVLAEVETSLRARQAMRDFFGEQFDAWLREVDLAKAEWATGRFDGAIEMLEGLNEELSKAGDRPEEIIASRLQDVEQAYFAMDRERVAQWLESLFPYQKDFPEIAEWSARAEQLIAIEPLWESFRAKRLANNFEDALVDLDAVLGIDEKFSPAVEAKQEIIATRGIEKTRAMLKDAAEALSSDDLSLAKTLLAEAQALGFLSEEVSALEERILNREKELAIIALLDDAFAAYQNQNFLEAKNIYKSILDQDPENAEAKEGYRNSTKLAVALVKFEAALGSAKKFIEQGRYPLAIKFFNRAIESKPQQISLNAEGLAIQNELKKQSVPVSVTIYSDGKTFVSIVGVFAPQKFKEKTLELVPDLYSIYGTRKSYQEERRSWAVTHGGNLEIMIKCTEKL